MGKLSCAKEILERLGFNKEAPESTQLAFLRFLKKEKEALEAERAQEVPLPEQLEFDFDENRLKSGSSS